MTITASDIKILASERMRDTADGGGHATAIALESGAENNMFPDISDSDRVWGYLRLRKVYAAVVNAGTDTLLGAYAILEDRPDDPATTAWIRRMSAGISEDRHTAISYMETVPWLRIYSASPPWTVGVGDRQVLTGAQAPKVGQVIHAYTPVTNTSEGVAVIVDVVDLGGGSYRCQYDGWPDTRWDAGIPGSVTKAEVVPPLPSAAVKATLAVSGALSAGDVSATCTAPLFAPAIPKLLGVYAPAGGGTDGYAPVAGVVPCVVPGDTLVVHHTDETAPTMVISGSVIACGRTSLASARVWGANGAEITAGFTVDLAAGTVTVINPSGWSQPVSVRHAIQDAIGCADIDQDTPGRLTFNRGLARAFPSGTMLSSALLLGDIQALVAAVFSQPLWTSTWLDSRIGDAIVGQYDDVGHPIVVTNRDAITERWAVEFLTTTSFRLFGEQLGEITTGSVNTALAPLNPATGQPYFHMAAAGWGDGWAAGNVLRFNTVGASVPIWVARVVMPSAPAAGADSLTLAIKGNIDA